MEDDQEERQSLPRSRVEPDASDFQIRKPGLQSVAVCFAVLCVSGSRSNIMKSCTA